MKRLFRAEIAAAMLLLGSVAGTAAIAQSVDRAAPPQTQNIAASPEGDIPPPIAGCEGYEDSCSEGSGRASGATGSGVFIDQIGEGNRVRIAQRRGSTTAFARVSQAGQDNAASIEQDAASAFADIGQTGDGNTASIGQGGSAHSTASIAHTGDGNQVAISQSASFLGHAAVARQNGDRNAIELVQTGEGNSAILTQDGDDNSMSVRQSGFNNALTWAQAGSGLTGPSVTMDGNDRALTILQYNTYAPR